MSGPKFSVRSRSLLYAMGLYLIIWRVSKKWGNNIYWNFHIKYRFGRSRGVSRKRCLLLILTQSSRVLLRFGGVVKSTNFRNGAVLNGRRRELRIPELVYTIKERISTSSGRVISRWAVFSPKFSCGFIPISSTFSARLVFFVFSFFSRFRVRRRPLFWRATFQTKRVTRNLDIKLG